MKAKNIHIISCDKKASLKGIPSEFESLAIESCSSLTSLEEMPKEMNNLKFLNLSQNRALDSVITVNEFFQSQDNAILNMSNDQLFSDRLVLDIHRLLLTHPNRIFISNQFFDMVQQQAVSCMEICRMLPPTMEVAPQAVTSKRGTAKTLRRSLRAHAKAHAIPR